MFKKKARPQGVAPIASKRDSPPLSSVSAAVGEGEEDNVSLVRAVITLSSVLIKITSYSETLEEMIALRKLKRATGGIDLERLNAGEQKKKRRKVASADGGDVTKVTDSGMIEGTQGGIMGKDRVRDEVDE